MNDLVFADDSMTEEDRILEQESVSRLANIIEENDYEDDYDYMDDEFALTSAGFGMDESYDSWTERF